MKAIRFYSYDGPEVLRYEEIPMPSPEKGEVLIKVHAAGVNPVDWKIREGYLKDMLDHKLPLVPGWDVSGVIEAVGAGVERLKVKDEVYSRPDISRDGAYAEYIVVKESEVALKPRSVDHVHAAGIPLASLTAWQSLFCTANLSAGQRVLIHAAAGGVGTFAVQLAKWRRAYVIGTSSERNLDYVRSLGADEVIDYRRVPFEDAVQNVDVVFDTVGGDTQEHSWKVLKQGGILVSIVSPPAACVKGVRQAFVFVQPNSCQLRDIAGLVDSGKLKVYTEAVLPLSAARRAQELSKEGHMRGKIVLKVA
ncbi:MAG TPA: NADPH:quinone reductase [Lentisphaeria bacterium]|nr:MAG: NADPH:quinone reductase [Lentisphaerae bacterium GWF2_50_93]HCE47013.1 NADPH:quinone reductase [Lentisphaeria bacterium]